MGILVEMMVSGIRKTNGKYRTPLGNTGMLRLKTLEFLVVQIFILSLTFTPNRATGPDLRDSSLSRYPEKFEDKVGHLTKTQGYRNGIQATNTKSGLHPFQMSSTNTFKQFMTGTSLSGNRRHGSITTSRVSADLDDVIFKGGKSWLTSLRSNYPGKQTSSSNLIVLQNLILRRGKIHDERPRVTEKSFLTPLKSQKSDVAHRLLRRSATSDENVKPLTAPGTSNYFDYDNTTGLDLLPSVTTNTPASHEPVLFIQTHKPTFPGKTGVVEPRLLPLDTENHTISTSQSPDDLTLDNTEAMTSSNKTHDASKTSMSCAQRCGEDTNFPCSCNEKCVVYKTCCDDLPVSCPDMYNQALMKYESLLSASTRCDSMSAILVVQSCPLVASESNRITNTNGGSSNLNSRATSRVSNSQTINVGSPDKGPSLSEILWNAPVTDYNSGIIYANLSIYECNRQESNIDTGNIDTSNFDTTQDITKPVVTWATQIGAPREDNLIGVHKKLNLSTYSYLPPASHPLAAGVLCYTDWTRACISELSKNLGLSDLTCNTSVSVYYKLRPYLRSLDKSKQIDANLVCANCLADYQRLHSKGYRFFLTGFKVLMSWSETPGLVQYSLPEESKSSRNPVPWHMWKCNISGLTTDQESGTCRAQECERRYLLTADGKCRKDIEVEFAIQQEVVYKGKTCRMDAKAFAEFIQCYAESSLKLKRTGKPFRSFHSKQRTKLDTLQKIVTTNTSMISVRMEMYLDSDDVDGLVLDLDVERFYTAALLFAKSYCSMNEQVSKEKNTTISTDSQMVLGALDPDISKVPEENDIASFPIPGANFYELRKYLAFTYCIQLSTDEDIFDAIKCDVWSFIEQVNSKILIEDLLHDEGQYNCHHEAGPDRTSNSSTMVLPLSSMFCLVLSWAIKRAHI